MEENKEAVKSNERLLFLGIIIALCIFIGFVCRGKSGCTAPAKYDTVSHTRDTVWVIEKSDTAYIPVLSTTTIYKPYATTDTILIIPDIPPTDTAKILAVFFKKRFYRDVQKTKYGNIVIFDTVVQNKIAGRRLITNFKIPSIHDTVVIRHQPVKRMIGYVGFSGMGNKNDLLYGVGADFSLKFKDDKIIGVGVNYLKGGTWMYEGQVKLPIRLRK